MAKYLFCLLFAFQAYSIVAQQTCNEVSVYFEPNNYSLQKKDAAEIKRVIHAIHPFTFQTVRIEGYSDTTGTAEANAVLAQKRIDAALYSLKPLLAPGIKIETLNLGESHPFSPTDLSRNRCVKIVFVLDTLVNIAAKGKGEIWLNTNALYNFNACDFRMRIHSDDSYFRLNRARIDYPAVPMSDTSDFYIIDMPQNCLHLYYFPGSFYNPVTHIGKFAKSFLSVFCGPNSDSLDFSADADKVRYDSLSKSYYLMLECHMPGGICCGTKPNCTSLVFVPEETTTHNTSFVFVTNKNKTDTILVADSLVWDDWECTSTKSDAQVYSIAFFDSTYQYLQGDIDQYRRTDTTSFNMYGKKYSYASATAVYLLKRQDYTSFTSPTGPQMFVKAKPHYLPGFYLKEYDTIIPFKHIKKRMYKSPVINYPFEFTLQQGQLILKGTQVKVKKKIKKSVTIIKLKPSKP